MPKDARFWRNVTIIGLLHLVVLLGLLWWSQTPKRVPKDVVWMEGGAGESAKRRGSGEEKGDAQGRVGKKKTRRPRGRNIGEDKKKGDRRDERRRERERQRRFRRTRLGRRRRGGVRLVRQYAARPLLQ